MELRLSGYIRRVLLGSESDDVKGWYALLRSKLRICWRGDPTLVLDHTIGKWLSKVQGRRIIFSIAAVSETMSSILLLDHERGVVYEGKLSLTDMRALLLPPPPDPALDVTTKVVDSPVCCPIIYT